MKASLRSFATGAGARRSWRWYRTALCIALLVTGVSYHPLFWGKMEAFCYDRQMASLAEQSSKLDFAVVAMDERSRRELEQGRNCSWDPQLHRRVLDTLLMKGAALVVFDVFFADCLERENASDLAFREFATSEAVVERALFAGLRYQVGWTTTLEPPRIASADDENWGLAFVEGFGDDYSLRRLPDPSSASYEIKGFLPAIAADRVSGKGGIDRPERERRWLRYSAVGDALERETVSFADVVLRPEEIPDGAFSGKTVWVGGSAETGFTGAVKDMFAVPFAADLSEKYLSGVGLMANLFQCYLDEDWLVSPSAWIEIPLLGLAAAIFVGAFLLMPTRVIPLTAVALATGLYGVMPMVSNSLGVVWNWLSLSAIAAPVSAIAVACLKLSAEARERQSRRIALRKYLPEHVADSIDRNYGLQLRKRRITAMVTDMEGFAERMFASDSAQAVTVLREYYDKVVAAIHERGGMVISFRGDSVLAAWGIPLSERDLAAEPVGLDARALDAAAAIVETGSAKIYFNRLTTRVGVTFGEVAAGDIGSSNRFEYTIVGSCVNMAARLEGLAKKLGVGALFAANGPEDHSARNCRFVGDFLLQGAERPLAAYQLLTAQDGLLSESQLARFASALGHLRDERREDALAAFQHALAEGADDPVARFYADELVRAGGSVRARGVVVVAK